MGNFLKTHLLKIGIGVLVGLIIFGASLVIDEIGMKPKIEELAGIWEGEFESDLSWTEVFESFEFFDEELTVLRNNQLLEENVSFVDVATFTKDKKFSINSNNDKTKQAARDHLERVFDALYINRSQLNGAYNLDFSGYTRSAFESFYAEMYEYDSYDLMLTGFAEAIADYYNIEEGTYKIDDDLIVLKIKGKSEKSSLEYKIEEGVLYLTWATDDDKPLVVEYKRVG